MPFAPSFDIAGPMAKNVWDLALLMDVMQGVDPEDVASKSQKALSEIDRFVLTQIPQALPVQCSVLAKPVSCISITAVGGYRSSADTLLSSIRRTPRPCTSRGSE